MADNILMGILGGGNLILFIKFLIERYDKKKEKEEEKNGIKQELNKIKKDGIRTQLLLLILLRPNEQTEILKVGEYYFNTLKANWYMTSMFKNWCDEQGLEPEWFKQE